MFDAIVFDAIIIGSGPAGVAAALALRGANVLLLDVGLQPPSAPAFPHTNLYEDRRTQPDLFDLLIGPKFEALHNLRYRPPISLKLKSPRMRYITAQSAELSPVRSNSFHAEMSFAAGGLANAWGGGVHRFTARDLSGFPVTVDELDPYYDELTRHIGISGASDDLEPWFGGDRDLQPPPELSRLAADLLASYHQHRAYCAQRGIALGRARNAVLTRSHRNRPAYSYGNDEFFRPHNPAVYNPAYTLRELIDEQAIRYAPNQLALHYDEQAGSVKVTARNLVTGELAEFHARTLLLAAGAINSAKLVLQSNRDTTTQLPLLDNSMALLPFFRWQRIGQQLNRYDSSLSQLTLLQQFQGTALQGSIYGTAGPLRSDILFSLPLSIGANVACLKRLAAATGAVMMFFPSTPHPANFLRLRGECALEIVYGEPTAGSPNRRDAIAALLPTLRKLGLLAFQGLCQYPGPGTAIHYAGTLPLQESPGPYQLHRDGRLFGTRAVYVVDGACFPRLPAKNLSFTIMANAMRIAALIRGRLV